MNFKSLLLFAVSLIIIVSSMGCSNAQSEKSVVINNKSKVVLIPDGKGGRALTFAVFIQNNTSKATKPFYVKLEIKDKWLRSKLKNSEFIVGQGINGKKLMGKWSTIKANGSYSIGATYNIESPVAENKLKTAIEQKKAVKVILLNEDKGVLASNFITSFGKDLTANGIDDTSHK